MDQVFAPWRMEWVERDDDPIEGCPFCVLPDREAHRDRESRIVARSDRAFVLLNNYPYNPGHVMVIPRRHTGRLGDLPEAVLFDHARLKVLTLEALEVALAPDGYNTGMNLGTAAGGSIRDHLHTHVVPRWAGDTNFMPVVSDTKVIVEALSDTWERLHDGFADLPGARLGGDDEAVRFSFPADGSSATDDT